MRLIVKNQMETDGRWIAEVPEIPGCLAYGETPDKARRAVTALALREIAGRVEHGEVDPLYLVVTFGETHNFGLDRRIRVRGEPVSDTILRLRQ